MRGRKPLILKPTLNGVGIMARTAHLGLGVVRPLYRSGPVADTAAARRNLGALACYGLAAIAALALASPAWGDTFKCMDSNGRATYTNIKEETKGKNCRVVMREISIVPAMPTTPKAEPSRANREESSPRGFPRVDRATQQRRDDDRRRILQEELSSEQEALAEAKAELTRQESRRNGDERNYQRVLDRLKRYQDDVERHERNVAALKKELEHVK